MIKIIFASVTAGIIGAFLGAFIVASVATVDTGERIMEELFTGPSLSTFIGGFLTCSALSFFYLIYVIKEEIGFAVRLFIAGIAGAVAGALAGLFTGFMNNLGAETLTLFFCWGSSRTDRRTPDYDPWGFHI